MKLIIVAILMSLCSWALAMDNVVENEREPSGKAVTLTFTEDLRFGADEEDDEYLWADPSSVVETNSKGHFFLADVRERRVLEFDQKGKFIRLIAIPGQGPGELQALADLAILADDRLIALNAGPGVLPKFLFFDSKGTFVKDLSPQGFSKIIISSEFSPDGKYFGGMYLGFNMETGVMQFRTGILNLEFEVLHMFSEQPQKIDQGSFQTREGITKFMGDLLTNAYKGTGMTTFDKDGNAYTAVSNVYEITKWAPDLKTKLMIIKRNYKPIPNSDERIAAIADQAMDSWRQGPMGNMITDSMVQKVIEQTELPLVNNPIYGIISMEDGKILVIHDVNQATGIQVVDIFSAKGKFLGQTTMDQWAFFNRNGLSSMVFKNQFAYCLETDDADENRVVRYKYELTKL